MIVHLIGCHAVNLAVCQLFPVVIISMLRFIIFSSNVLRAFAGKYYKAQHGNYDNWKQLAYSKINRMTPDQMYNHLRGNLPYPETREYIKKVGERMGKYQS